MLKTDLFYLGWDVPTKIKLIRKLTFLLTSNPLHILMQKSLKSVVNCINPRLQYSTFRSILAIVKNICG